MKTSISSQDKVLNRPWITNIVVLSPGCNIAIADNGKLYRLIYKMKQTYKLMPLTQVIDEP